MNNQEVQKHFSKQANDYESLMQRLVPNYIQQSNIISKLLPSDSETKCRVLDLGCGNGILSEMILTKLQNSFVVGFDITEEMLQAYEDKLKEFKGRFKILLGDYRNDNIGENYDIIIAGLTLHHLTWEERKEFCKTIYSSLNKCAFPIFDRKTDKILSN